MIRNRTATAVNPLFTERSGDKSMPNITFNGKRIQVRAGANLRRALLKTRCDLYNDDARLLNCHGRGMCGTCAVKIQGEVSPPTKREQWRLSFPPHKKESGLRLACQCEVVGDMKVTKMPGFWGQKLQE